MGWVAVSLQLCGIWSWPAPTSADGRGKAGVGFQPAAGFWRRRMSAQPSAPGSRVRHAEKRCWLGSSACFSGHPGLWDVLPGRGAAAGEEAHRHRWDCLLWLPQGERHLPLPGREWDLSCERWRPPWIHRELIIFCLSAGLCSGKDLLWLGVRAKSRSSAVIALAQEVTLITLETGLSTGVCFHDCRNSDAGLEEVVKLWQQGRTPDLFDFSWLTVSIKSNKRLCAFPWSQTSHQRQLLSPGCSFQVTVLWSVLDV